MAAMTPIQIGFLSIMEEDKGYLGGYLVTNNWGRPSEFRLSTAVKPNRVQEILYAGTLESYICGDLIGKSLVEKANTQPDLIVADHQAVLPLRRHLEVPVLWLPSTESSLIEVEGLLKSSTGEDGLEVFSLTEFQDDQPLIQEHLESLDGILDLNEPFIRIREAIGEARQMGVTARK